VGAPVEPVVLGCPEVLDAVVELPCFEVGGAVVVVEAPAVDVVAAVLVPW
jgi:hypothetical protein